MDFLKVWTKETSQKSITCVFKNKKRSSSCGKINSDHNKSKFGMYKDFQAFSNRYRVQSSVLCHGGQGVIKRAFDNTNGQTVAIKFLKKNNASWRVLKAARLEK